MLEPLDAVGVEPTGDHDGGVHTRIIPSKNHCWDIISGLFSCKFYTPCAAGRDLVSILTHRLRQGNENRRAHGFLEDEMVRPMARPLVYHCKELKLWSPLGSFHGFFLFL